MNGGYHAAPTVSAAIMSVAAVAHPPLLEDDPVLEPARERATSRTGVRMSVEQFLGLPPDRDFDRWLVNGELWEKPMTVRNRFHTNAEFNVAGELKAWLKTQPEPRLWGGSGEAGVRLPGRETAVGVDVALFDAATAADQPPPVRGRSTLWVGVPILAVEVISPSDEEEEVSEKVLEYLGAGVAQIWLVRPILETVTVHRPGAPPAIYSGDQTLPGGPELPGFGVRTGDLFGG